MPQRLISPNRSRSYLWRIPLIFGTLGLLWIYGSDKLVYSAQLHLAPESAQVFQTAKGMLYVCLSTLVLYVLLYRFYRRVDEAGLLYRQLYAESPMPMLLVDAQTAKVLVVNRAALSWYGLSRDEIVGRPMDALLQPADAEPSDTLLNQATKGGYDCGLWSHVGAEGLARYARAFATRLTHPKKAALLFLLVDETEHLRAEQQASRYADRLTQTQDNVSDGYFTLSPDWRILAVNKAFERMTGYSREQAVGGVLWDLFPGSYQRLFFPMYSKAMFDRESVYFEEYDNTTDMTFSLSVYPVPEGIAIYARNITDEIQARERERTRQRELDAVINATTDAIWYIDSSYQVRISNRAYDMLREKAMGPETAESRKLGAPENPGTNASAILQEKYAEALVNQQVVFETETAFLDGSRRLYEIVLNPVLDDTETVIGVGCFARDITLRKQHENTILAQNQHLRRIAWYQSHLVRGPVASILGLVSLFDKAHPDEPFNYEILEHLRKTATQLDKVIHNIVAEADEGYIPTGESRKAESHRE